MAEAFEAGKQLFADGKYVEAKAQLMEAASMSGDDAALGKQIQLWIRKCNTHIVDAVPTTAAPTAESAAPTPASSAPVAPAVTVPFTGTVRFEWFQTPTTLTFTFFVKNRLESDVRVTSHGRGVDVTIALDASGRDYQYSVDSLFAPIAANPTVTVKSMKVEVCCQKETAYHWPSLEVKDGDVVRTIEQPEKVAAVTAPAASSDLKYPNSKGKDWAHFKLQDEEEEKPTGDAALNALFKQIYGNGTDEQRKAMIKSFTESNGTVLSTNWDEVGSKKVVGEPPKGMEAKPFEV